MASYWFGVSPNTVREISSQKETGHSGRHLGFQCSGVGGRRIKELRVLTDADTGVPHLPITGRQGARADPGGYRRHFRGSTVPWWQLEFRPPPSRTMRGEKKLYCFQLPGPWYLISAALEGWDSIIISSLTTYCWNWKKGSWLALSSLALPSCMRITTCCPESRLSQSSVHLVSPLCSQRDLIRIWSYHPPAWNLLWPPYCTEKYIQVPLAGSHLPPPPMPHTHTSPTSPPTPPLFICLGPTFPRSLLTAWLTHWNVRFWYRLHSFGLAVIPDSPTIHHNFSYTALMQNLLHLSG